MTFTKKPAEWYNPGVEPSDELKNFGWKAGMKPPADHFNWQWNRTYEAIKELQEKAGTVKTINSMSPDENGNIDVIVDTRNAVLYEEFIQHVQNRTSGLEVHGLRIDDGILKYYDGAEWKMAKVGEAISGLQVKPILDLAAIVGRNRIGLRWTDPDNTKVGDMEVAMWAGTKVLRKLGGYPQNEFDGTVVVTSTVRNQYASKPFIDIGLANGETYYYAAFPYTREGLATVSTLQRAKAVPDASINESPLNPPEEGIESQSNYFGIIKRAGFLSEPTAKMEDLEGAWAGSRSTQEAKLILENSPFFQLIRPVLLLNGRTSKVLNKNDFAYDVNGNPVDIATGLAGDVMIEIPVFSLKVIQTASGTIVRLAPGKITTDGWNCNAFIRNGAIRDKIYVGAYMGANVGGKLRSLSNQIVETRKSISELRTMAQANGVGYQVISYYQYVALMILVSMYEVGMAPNANYGRTIYVPEYTGRITGTTNSEGMSGNVLALGSYTYSPRVKKIGMEDFYQGYNHWLDGIRTDGNCNFLLATGNYNNTGESYTQYLTEFTNAGINSTNNGIRTSINENTLFLPVTEGSADSIPGKFSPITHVQRSVAMKTGSGNPTANMFDFVFSDYVERDLSKPSFDGSRLVYLP